MPTEILAANLGHQRLTGASKGVALTTTPAFTTFIRGTEHVTLSPRNSSTAVVVRYAFCPYLVILKADSSDGLKTKPLDYSVVAQDGSTATSVDLSSLAAGRYLYVGSAIPFRGVNIDVDAVNGTATTVLTVSYWNGSAWTDTSDTDGTINNGGGISLAVDGSVTWTVPAAWVSASLGKIFTTGSSPIAAEFKWRDTAMYWTRWEWDDDMDSAVTLDHMLGINESIAYAEVSTGVATEGRVNHGFGSNGVGGVEALTDSGTANLLVNCSALNGYFSTGVVEST
jgi:hypothetical protein